VRYWRVGSPGLREGRLSGVDVFSSLFLPGVAGCILQGQNAGIKGSPPDRNPMLLRHEGSPTQAVATISIAVALRTELAVPARDIILLMYSVLAALTGMAYFIEASKMSWKLAWGPVGFWLVGVVMLFHRETVPIYFGAYVALGSVAYGLYLRKGRPGLGEEASCQRLRASGHLVLLPVGHGQIRYRAEARRHTITWRCRRPKVRRRPTASSASSLPSRPT